MLCLFRWSTSIIPTKELNHDWVIYWNENCNDSVHVTVHCLHYLLLLHCQHHADWIKASWLFLPNFKCNGHYYVLCCCSDSGYVTTVWFDSLDSLLSKLVSMAVSLSMSQKRSLFRGRFCVWVTVDVAEKITKTVTIIKIVQ